MFCQFLFCTTLSVFHMLKSIALYALDVYFAARFRWLKFVTSTGFHTLTLVSRLFHSEILYKKVDILYGWENFCSRTLMIQRHWVNDQRRLGMGIEKFKNLDPRDS
ncbi:unnamed protein product [Calicophoron daubneyi]|uniref:Uncharacterized protein n=1 Tax=Calicophoron daubneyi TaxID=300641 RepID=A0AAV2T9Z8_CALDB